MNSFSSPYFIIAIMKKAGRKKDLEIKALKLENKTLLKNNAWLESRCVQLLVVKKLKRKTKRKTK